MERQNSKQISLLIQALRTPESCLACSPEDWDLLVRQARQADLLAHLCLLLDAQGLLGRVPELPFRHLDSARSYAQAQHRVVRWEVRCLRRALVPIGVSVILLKGAAYVMAGLPPGHGRLFNDIDILVPRERLEETEQALLVQGWMTTHLNAYDQRYYRRWMHELPPLRHIRRRTVLDVHHNILPETARLHPSPEKLIAAAQSFSGDPEVRILAPADMVLHSATHLFHDGELEHGLRDLVDLDALLRDFGRDERFWKGLMPRARELDLLRPLYYALRYTQRILATPVPDAVQQDIRAGCPGVGLKPVMDALFNRALMVDHPSCTLPLTGVARWLLYIRAHYLRMPLYLLVPHLLRKAFRPQQD